MKTLHFNKNFILLDKFYERSTASDIIFNEQILIQALTRPNKE